MFDIGLEDIERYDSYDPREQKDKEPTHIFGRLYGPDFQHPSAVRSVGPSPDYTLIRSWLRRCEKEHKQCTAESKTDKLNIITLIDVINQRLVRYKPGLQYVALSYVWGRVPTPKRAPERPFDLPTNISKTIKHAMVVAKEIGVPYLWADAVCINQHNEAEKLEQLPLMDYIYEKAFATIISLGDSAKIGIPGVDDGPPRYWQLAAEFGPVKLLARCPTLQSQLQSSVWSTRGWTYQESLFSRRCIFMSQHQVYFHCNGMMCTEDSPSMTEIKLPTTRDRTLSANVRHHTADLRYVQENSLVSARMQATFEREGTMGLYREYLERYLHRELSVEEDAINAFAAVLERLKRDYLPAGFLYGLPRASFAHALLWTGTGIFRRKKKDGSPIFPTWSWAGWKPVRGGSIVYPYFILISAPISVPLEISSGKEQLHVPPRTATTVLPGPQLELQRLWDSYRRQNQKPISLKRMPSLQAGSALRVDGPVMTLRVSYDPTTQAVWFRAPSNLPNVIQMAPPPNPTNFAEPPRDHDFLVLGCGQGQGAGYTPLTFGLMMLKWERDGEASRAGNLELNLTKGVESFWKLSNVKRRVFWLI